MKYDMNRMAGFALAALLSTSAHAAFDPYEGSDNSIPQAHNAPQRQAALAILPTVHTPSPITHHSK